MKKLVVVFIMALLVVACNSKKEGNMRVKGTIKGLKKGTLYLQKMQDTVLVSVDSVSLNGTDTFSLTDNVASPVLYYLTFDGNTTDKRILFFGEKGNIIISDDVEKFGLSPKISGSKNQDALNNFLKINSRFKTQRLEFIKKEFDARKSKDNAKIETVQKDFERMIKRKYLYTTNFALTNANLEVAPYIALTELYDANIKLLDTINKALSADVKTSLYGKKLNNYIEKIKTEETNN